MTDSQSLSIFENDRLSVVERQFCAQVLAGHSTDKTLKTLGLTKYAYHVMRSKNPAFEQALLQARAILQEDRVDKLHEIAANGTDVARDKLLSDNIKWVAGKYNPRLFGEKIDVNISQTIDIGSALAEARARSVLRPRCDPVEIEEGEIVATPSIEPTSPTDKQSVPAVPDIFS